MTELSNRMLDNIIQVYRFRGEYSPMGEKLISEFKAHIENVMLRGEVPSEADQITLSKLLEAEKYQNWKRGVAADKAAGREFQAYDGKVVNPYEGFKGYDRDFLVRYTELTGYTHEEAEKITDRIIDQNPSYRSLVETGRGYDFKLFTAPVSGISGTQGYWLDLIKNGHSDISLQSSADESYKHKLEPQDLYNNNPTRSEKAHVEVISAVDLAKRYMSTDTDHLTPEQQEMARYMSEKTEAWMRDNPMLLYGEKDGKPFIYDMSDREYDKYMVLNSDQQEKYIQKLLTNKETADAFMSDMDKNVITADVEKKDHTQAVSNGQNFGLLELLKSLLQAFGFIPPEQERNTDIKNDVAETQQNRQEQQEQQSTTVDRSIAAQAKALSAANTEALVAEQQQSQEVSRGMHM